MYKKVPKIEESTKFSFFTSIWIVPLVALVIALWLAWQHYTRLGPEIQIIFPKNEGLQAGQSVIKYKDVPIGKVTKIQLTEDGKEVIIYARMEKMATDYLNESTKFWIVKPEVGVTGVSGLETLISGTYINMYAKKSEQTKEAFYGLAHAYRKNTEGEYFVLSASEGYGIIKGTPIYYKDLEAGQVEYVSLNKEGRGVDFIIFINQTFLPYLHKDSKFWVMSTLDVDISQGRLDLSVAPLTTLIHSGIVFSAGRGEDNETLPEKFRFPLYKNFAMANQNRIGEGKSKIRHYKVITHDPIAKLTKGAPVRYSGFDVGRVSEVALHYERESHKMRGEIMLDIDTAVFADKDEGEANFYTAIREGLRVRLAPIDPITGRLFVDLVFVDANQTAPIAPTKHYTLLPTIPMAQGGVMDGVERMIAKINALPLDTLIQSLTTLSNDSDGMVKEFQILLKELHATATSLKEMSNTQSFVAMPKKIEWTLKELDHTLRVTRKLMKGYESNSLVTQQVTQTLQSVTKTSEEMREFLRMLNRKPNSLIFGDK